MLTIIVCALCAVNALRTALSHIPSHPNEFLFILQLSFDHSYHILSVSLIPLTFPLESFLSTYSPMAFNVLFIFFNPLGLIRIACICTVEGL